MHRAHYWISHILEDLVDYAERHDLGPIAAKLTRSRSVIMDHLGMIESENETKRREQVFRQVLDDLIQHCDFHRLGEVQAHLERARTAWDCSKAPEPVSNVVTLPMRTDSRR